MEASAVSIEPSTELLVEWLGEVPYGSALDLQASAVAHRLAGQAGDRLLLLEHPEVVTLGRSTDPGNLRKSPKRLRALGIDVFEVGRGGDITYHAPGQLVGYPILDLAACGRRDVHDHLRRLEAGLIDALEEFGIPAGRVEGWTGVFIDRARSAMPEGAERKIASIGVGLRRWVTFHGFALNVTLDLAGFDSIVPCGLHGVEMTSVARELEREGRAGEYIPVELGRRVRDAVARAMRARLGMGSGAID
ncbi:MAG: lipoyl(octanoyl) transferase LipB [bacterium]|nr:lipoyl(octanoyl) transferase [Deltaproteobacteria bacterium]MCP4906596.1 lipoyl(octanoyl) transferase LipB [bacterium]